jgi:hypothetical protein
LIILTATLAQSFCSLNFTRQKHWRRMPYIESVCGYLWNAFKTTKNFSRSNWEFQLSTSTARQN